jgi:hypothetical protein
LVLVSSLRTEENQMNDGIIVRRVEAVDVYPWLINRHYAKRLCPISHSFGAFDKENMIGIVTYGTPLSSTLKDGVCGIEWADKVLELNRLCCESRKNLASTIVGRSLSMLPRPSIVCFIRRYRSGTYWFCLPSNQLHLHRTIG